MTDPAHKRVSYDVGCMKSLKKLPDKVTVRFMDMMTRYMAAPAAHGLNLETVTGAKDSAIKSLRLDQGYRAIAFEAGQDIMFVHVNEHDKAYRWAAGRRVKLDTATNRIRVIDEVETEAEKSGGPAAAHLFDEVSDERLLSLGVPGEEIPMVRFIADQQTFDDAEDRFDSLTYNILLGLAAGYSDEEIRSITGVEADSAPPEAPKDEPSFGEMLDTDESRQTIFTPKTEEEIRWVFEDGLEAWRVFLHPEQRRRAYGDFNGPAMVLGGAGTGKTVVAMHRAKHLADLIKADDGLLGRKVLFTTFTTNLARDIEANLRTLCPEHLEANPPRIEVVNLDRWVSQFLKRKKFERRVVFHGSGWSELQEVWQEVFVDHNLPDGLSEDFVKAEWTQVVQAKGLTARADYLKVPRVGRGTPLDRRKRADLWKMFEDYRARLISLGLAEPDDAYREAVQILQSPKRKDASGLPYTAVVVDEAQDMGEQAFRLIRAIVPERSGGGGDRNSLFIVGDAHQRIYARRASMSACGINIRGRSRRLRLNYRTTQEIRNWAVSVLEGVSVDDLDEGTDTLRGYVSLLHGGEPDLVACSSEEEEIDGLVEWIRNLTAGEGQSEDRIRAEDVGVLCARNDDRDLIEDGLRKAQFETSRLQAGKPDDRSVPGIRIATMHRAKGLEFAAVAIPFLSRSAFPPQGAVKAAVDDADRADTVDRYRSLLHVAATRAKTALRVSWSGEPTSLISG